MENPQAGRDRHSPSGETTPKSSEIADAEMGTLLRRSGVQPHYRQPRLPRVSDFDGLSVSEIDDKGLFICGGVGTGKTYLSVALMVREIENRGITGGTRDKYSMMWFYLPEFLAKIKGDHTTKDRVTMSRS